MSREPQLQQTEVIIQAGVNDLPTGEALQELRRKVQEFADTLPRYWRRRFLRTGRWRSHRDDDAAFIAALRGERPARAVLP